MQIVRIPDSSPLELQVDGRLDSYWADHLNTALADILREGHDRVRLNLAAVEFLSSAGIRVLIRYHKQLAGIQGQLRVASPSAPVRSVLETAGLATMLIDEGQAAPASARNAAAVPAAPSATQLNLPHLQLQAYALQPGATLHCEPLGATVPLRAGAYTAAHAQPLACTEDLIAVGIGAFGGDFEACRPRFGELLVSCGAIAYMPSDGASVPDYLLGAGTVAPEAMVLSGLAGRGRFAHMAHFAPAESGQVVPLTALAEAALQLSAAPVAALAFVGEVSGLVGAALRRSPAQPGSTDNLFAFPAVRSWLSFTAERAFARSQSLVVGFVARPDAAVADLPPAVRAQLRPLSAAPDALLGHFHAAAFPFRPLRKGPLELRETVTTLFSNDAVSGLLHLLHDERPLLGAGQSEFVRGALWTSPLLPASSTTGN